MKYFPSSTRGSWWLVSGVVLLFICTFISIGIVSLPKSKSITEVIITIIVPTLLALFPIKVWLDMVNIYPDTWVASNGLYISVNIFWKAKIEWSSIKNIEYLPKRKGVLILASYISKFHHGYGKNGLDGVRLSPKGDSEQLINIIEENVLSLQDRIIKTT